MDRTKIGRLVRERREARGLTLRTAAPLVGLSHGGWGHIETGVVGTSIDTLAEIARVLDARWEVRLVPSETALRDPGRATLVETVDRLADQLGDREVRMLLAQLQIYEEELVDQRQTRT